MQILQHVAELQAPLHYLLLRLRAELAEHLAQIVTLYVIHYNEEGIVCFNDVNNGGKVGMRKVFEHLGFGDEAVLFHLKVFLADLPYLFDRPVFVCPLVSGKINHTHAAAADNIQYSVFIIDELTYL